MGMDLCPWLCLDSEKFMKIKLSLAIFLGLFLFLLSLPAPAQAYSYMTTDEVNEDTVIKAIEDKQDFSKISCQKVVELVSHFMEDTGGYDLVPNGYGSSWGSDSRFSTDLITSKQGCYHYAEFVSKSIYGSEEADEIIRLRNDYENYTVEGIRSFIEEEAQAGEHLRIDYLHSMVYLASNYKGIYTLQYYGRWEEPFLSYMTYDLSLIHI